MGKRVIGVPEKEEEKIPIIYQSYPHTAKYLSTVSSKKKKRKYLPIIINI